MTTLVASPAALPSLPPKTPALLVPFPFGLDHLAEPAAAVASVSAIDATSVAEMPFLGGDAGVRGLALDLHFPVLLADRARSSARRRACCQR